MALDARVKCQTWLGLPLLSLAFVACTVHEPELAPSPRVAAREAFAESDRDGSAIEPGTPWWRQFRDPALDGLVAEALASNLELSGLVARIEQAEALQRQARGRLFPRVDGGAGVRSEWVDDGTQDEQASLGLLFGWEIDLWGRLRSARQAAAQLERAARQDWLAARLLLSASVAEAYFEIGESRLQLELLVEQIRVNSMLLDLTRLRFGQGLSSIVDVLQQREQLASTRSLVPAVEARLEALEYSLDVLIGRAPGARPRLPRHAMSPPPVLSELGVPADLLTHRPDLLAEESRVVALDYRVAEALADRFPRLDLGAALSARGALGLETLVASALADVVGPIVDAGVRRAEVDLQRARLEEAVADYSEAYLLAVEEVETAVLSERKQTERVVRLEDQLRIANRLLTETRNRYRQGLTDYLPVLAAIVTVQNLERFLITQRRATLSFRVAVHRALGGPMDLPGAASAAEGT